MKIGLERINIDSSVCRVHKRRILQHQSPKSHIQVIFGHNEPSYNLGTLNSINAAVSFELTRLSFKRFRSVNC